MKDIANLSMQDFQAYILHNENIKAIQAAVDKLNDYLYVEQTLLDTCADLNEIESYQLSVKTLTKLTQEVQRQINMAASDR